MERLSIIYDALLSLHAEMFLDKALKDYKVEQLYEAIDEALQRGDQNEFYTLTSELNLIQENTYSH
ncbi:IDEAL domain-containing protein [Longirhabdus pacifica]|uniref:IDEAL domain-containing protein n=1 Tax=Longirhabdus pacifica TaxID=2305227 RepID=UPI0010092535|nr:IDEAL domain-containing protein [Longirhabdus pacifica]